MGLIFSLDSLENSWDDVLLMQQFDGNGERDRGERQRWSHLILAGERR